MCSECRQNPCDPRCPNADEPEAIYFCESCGNGIFKGDYYWDIDEMIICENCIEDMKKET